MMNSQPSESVAEIRKCNVQAEEKNNNGEAEDDNWNGKHTLDIVQVLGSTFHSSVPFLDVRRVETVVGVGVDAHGTNRTRYA